MAQAWADAHLFRVCEVGWEIGPGPNDTTCFSISPPREDPECTQLARLLMERARAPELPGWVFSLFKPHRDWNLAFTVRDNSENRTIDAKRWEIAFEEFSDGTFDLYLKPDESCRDIDSDNLSLIATMIVDGELGEAASIALIRGISAVDDIPDDLGPGRPLEPGLLHNIILKQRYS